MRSPLCALQRPPSISRNKAVACEGGIVVATIDEVRCIAWKQGGDWQGVAGWKQSFCNGFGFVCGCARGVGPELAGRGRRTSSGEKRTVTKCYCYRNRMIRVKACWRGKLACKVEHPLGSK